LRAQRGFFNSLLGLRLFFVLVKAATRRSAQIIHRRTPTWVIVSGMLAVQALVWATPGLAAQGFPSLTDLFGRMVSLEQRLNVVVFVDPECPAVAPRLAALNRLRDEFAPAGVGFAVAYVDPQGDVASFQRHARECAPAFIAINDRAQHLARFVGATYLSEAVILGRGGNLLYRGRVDDRVSAPGASRPTATQHDLRTALKQLLEGAPGFIAGPKGFGCPLPQKVVQ
jgi:hypothetical protein